MTPFDRQLDRIGRDRPLGAPVSGIRACPSAGGSTQQAVSAGFGCTCGHSRHDHRGYGRCEAPGCICNAFRHPSQKTTAAPAATGRRS